MRTYINIIKIIAAFLITNSHMGSLYPKDYLSFGGALGNALFFVVAGFCLSSKRSEKFTLWMGKRLQRLYIPLWSVTLILLLIGDIKIDKSYFCAAFLFPYNSFWFVSAIIVNYVLFYFIRKYFVEKLSVVAIIAVVIYIIWYVGFLDINVWSVESAGYFKYVFYFIVMLMGVALKKYEKVIAQYLKGKSILLACLSVICFLGHVIMRLLTIKFSALLQFQFIVQIFTWGFAVAFFLYMWSMEDFLKQYFISPIFRTIADSTLEIYLVNMLIINRMDNTVGILNVLISFALIFIIGCGIHVITSRSINQICLYWKKLHSIKRIM